MNFRQRKFLIAAFLVAVFGMANFALAVSAEPVFIYKRVFKESVPEFIEIKIPESSGNPTFEIRQLDEEPGATPFEVTPALRSRIFSLIGQLNHFKGVDLDVHLKSPTSAKKHFAGRMAPNPSR